MLEWKHRHLDCLLSFRIRLRGKQKLTQAVSYLGIDARDVSKWLDTIIHYGKEKRDRIKAYDILKNAKFDIVDTVNGFMKLYRG